MIAQQNHAVFFAICEQLWLVNRARDAAALWGNHKRAARLGRIAANLTDELLSIP